MATPRSIHEFDTGEANASSLFLVDNPDLQAESGKVTQKVSLTDIGECIGDDIVFTQQLSALFATKKIFAALNQIAYKQLVGTLTAGQTSITFSDANITTDSNIQYFTNKFGVYPTACTVQTGSVTLAFEAQSSNLGVKVRIS